MSFGNNLQYLRKLSFKMTQENLASKMNVSRQTISKWETGEVYPEINKLEDICKIFNVNANDLLFGDMIISSDAYSDISIETIESFKYIEYAVISINPEDDASMVTRNIAKNLGITNPNIIGWNFPILSQEQVNVYHMHGYCSALVLPTEISNIPSFEIMSRPKQRYATLTITNPFNQPFVVIPNAFKLLLQYMDTNQLMCTNKDLEFSFEKVYTKNDITYMEIYISID